MLQPAEQGTCSAADCIWCGTKCSQRSARVAVFICRRARTATDRQTDRHI